MRFMKARAMAISAFYAFAIAAVYPETAVSAAKLSDVLPPDLGRELSEKGTMTVSRFRNDAMTRGIPLAHALLKEADARLASLKPDLSVEAVFLIKRPGKKPAGELASLYGIFHAFSTLEGITYWSATRNKTWVFYEKSFVVESPERPFNMEKLVKLPDPVFPLPPGTADPWASIPAFDARTVFQSDTTFGRNLYRYDFLKGSDAFLVRTENLTPLNYGFVKLIDEGNLANFFLVLDMDEGVLLYAISAAKAFLLPGVEGKIETSFSNRAIAICSWFKERSAALHSR